MISNILHIKLCSSKSGFLSFELSHFEHLYIKCFKYVSVSIVAAACLSLALCKINTLYSQKSVVSI